MPAWTSGAAWLDALMDVLATADGDAARRRVRIAAGTLLRIADVERRSADVETGRGITTSNATVAELARVGERTAERGRALLITLGFAVAVVEGRYLTTEERLEARQRHGGRQDRAASVRALTLPRPAPIVESGDLPSPREGSPISHLSETPTRRASARHGAATRHISRRSRNIRPPRPLRYQRLAAELVDALPWLGRGRHIGNVVAMLEGLGIPDGWSGYGLKREVDRMLAGSSSRVASPYEQRSPVGYARWLISRALPRAEQPDLERAAAVAAERQATRDRQRQERELEAARVDAIDQAAVAEALRQMHAAFPRRATRRSH